MPRTKSSSAGPFDSFELTLSDVYLLTTQNQSEVAVPGLKVLVDPVGLTLVKPDGTVGVVLEWGKLQSLGTGERMQLPSGTPAVIVEAVSNSRTHRFAVPTDDPDGLEAVVGELAKSKGAVGGTGATSGKRRWWQRG
jgi:hypothetical protein